MKKISALFASLFTASAFAHDDKLLNPTFHEFYHALFYGLLAALVVCAGVWGIKRMSKKKD